MHNNSVNTYSEERPNLSQRAFMIMSWLKTHKHPISDRDIKNRMGFDDMNMVRPRITELIKDGYVQEVGAEICPTTNKRVRLVQFTEHVAQKPDTPAIQGELF